jgi:hypothetical protein
VQAGKPRNHRSVTFSRRATTAYRIRAYAMYYRIPINGSSIWSPSTLSSFGQQPRSTIYYFSSIGLTQPSEFYPVISEIYFIDVPASVYSSVCYLGPLLKSLSPSLRRLARAMNRKLPSPVSGVSGIYNNDRFPSQHLRSSFLGPATWFLRYTSKFVPNTDIQ